MLNYENTSCCRWICVLSGVKLDVDVRKSAALSGLFRAAFLYNRNIYALSNTLLQLYQLVGSNIQLVKTVNLQKNLDVRDLLLSSNGKELYLADYTSKAVIAVSLPVVTDKTGTLPIKYIRCQFRSCHPTSLSLDKLTGDLLVGCLDDRKLVTCSTSGLTQVSISWTKLHRTVCKKLFFI